jgi:hypothetical protein
MNIRIKTEKVITMQDFFGAQNLILVITLTKELMKHIQNNQKSI